MKTLTTIYFIFITLLTIAQESIKISDMKWGSDFNIHITFSNDSTLIQDIKGLYHVNENPGTKKDFTYYPVALDPTFVESLKNKNLNPSYIQDSSNTNTTAIKTLWNTIHPTVGGGFIHFINSLIYTLESKKLSLNAALLKRPESKWKPKPMTESFKRTKNWHYYIPENMTLAQKEYKIQAKNNELGDLRLLPPQFIELFLNTNDKQYNQLVKNKQLNKIAIIDMMRLLVSSKYLGAEQIEYIQAAVIKAIMKYNINNLPSVIIFDNYNAAVAMTLNEEGYKIDKVVFDNEQDLSPDEISTRIETMKIVINEINLANKEVFERKLKNYYTN